MVSMTMISVEGSGMLIKDTHPAYVQAFALYGKTHRITPVIGTRADLRKLKPNESIIWGDGRTFHFRLTKL